MSFALENDSVLNTQYNEVILPPPLNILNSNVNRSDRLQKPGLRSMLYGLSLKM